MENGETEEQTAIRETKEETNLIVNIDSSKRFELSYLQKENIYKTVVYFIAYINDINNLKLKSDEVIEAKWIKIDEVEDILSFENLKKLWGKVLKSIK
jgi:8-oxo-dGTP pyrophosphatase MutT (NUDIX family)